jgi:succinoglycan biosynthesis protein ExoV
MKLFYAQGKEGTTNFGDDLNVYLWEKIIPGILDNDSDTIFIGIGTILNEKWIPVARKKIVFSSGVGYGQIPKIDDSWKIYCVRGPLSAKKLGLPLGLAITDGAVLIKKFFASDGKKIYRFSYMPHQNQAHCGGKYWKKICEYLGFGYIDPRWETEQVLNSISSTKCLITESLHGAIVADTLRVPWKAVKTSDKILAFKWEDWCASVGLEYKPSSILPLWSSEGKSNIIVSARRSIKLKIVPHQLLNIAKNSRPFLSKESLLKQLIDKLEQKCNEFKKDVCQGIFR